MIRFRRQARLTPALVAGVLFASALAAPSASAAFAQPAGSARAPLASWSVTPGGAITGHSGTATLEDKDTGNSITCTSSTLAGTLKSGSGLSGTGIGSITSVQFSNCTWESLVFSVQASASKADPWRLNAKSYASGSGVTSGTITNITAKLSSAGCVATVAGPAATTPGTAEITYTNSTHKLQLLSRTGGTLHIWNVSGCVGLLSNGDIFSCRAGYTTTPAQTFVSPADLDLGTTSRGPPC
jgi:hypothetical protein